ncbi:hypothetical protein QJS10_CPB04g00586 [Acorus calamus]|uniref:Uncharacterized protein n=1 Tax=Acorus calamus TaxID=4465 RepID=A0AAV9F0H2_ACOCL|nr:hypothetical protein QJS10_CPB04g00586 [Acorus calamus]
MWVVHRFQMDTNQNHRKPRFSSFVFQKLWFFRYPDRQNDLWLPTSSVLQSRQNPDFTCVLSKNLGNLGYSLGNYMVPTGGFLKSVLGD